MLISKKKRKEKKRKEEKRKEKRETLYKSNE